MCAVVAALYVLCLHNTHTHNSCTCLDVYVCLHAVLYTNAMKQIDKHNLKIVEYVSEFKLCDEPNRCAQYAREHTQFQFTQIDWTMSQCLVVFANAIIKTEMLFLNASLVATCNEYQHRYGAMCKKWRRTDILVEEHTKRRWTEWNDGGDTLMCLYDDIH